MDEFNTCIICGKTESKFFDRGIQILFRLVKISAPKEAYLNFYLNFLLLAYAIALATNEELSDELRLHFRDSLTDFVEKVEKEFADISVEDKVHFCKFRVVLKKVLLL